MEATITLDNKRVSVKCPYNPELIMLYKSINKAYWNNEEKAWSFPLDAFEMIRDFLEMLKYKVSTVDQLASGCKMCVLKGSYKAFLTISSILEK